VTGRFDRVGPGVQRIIGNMSWLMLDRIVRMGLGLVVGVWVARYLGPNEFGDLNFAISFVALFGAVVPLGLEGIVIRELLHNVDDTSEILGTTFTLRTAGALIGAVLCLVMVRLTQAHDRQALILVSILSLTLIFQVFDTIDLFFQSQVRSKITVWAKNSAFVIFAIVRVVLIKRGASVWTFAAANSGEIALGAIGLIIGYEVGGGELTRWRVSSSRALTLLKQGWPVMFSGMAVMVYMRIDTVMLKAMQGDFAVGLYAAATKISEVWYFIPVAIVSSVSPAIMKVKHDVALFESRMRKLFSAVAITAYVIGSVVAFSSHFVIHLLYSSAYSGAAPVLAVHIWASVFVFLGVAQSPWDLSKDLMSLSLYRTLCGAVLNIVMNLYLIPKYSAMGAAIATVVSYAIASVFANAFSAKTRPVFYMQMRSLIPAKFWDLSDERGDMLHSGR